MTRIIDLVSTANPSDNAVFVVTDTVDSKKITVSDLKNLLIKPATANTSGVVKVGAGLRIDPSGTLSVINFSGYVLPPATKIKLGGVIVGQGLSVTNDGLLSVDAVSIPKASSTTFGTVKVGTGLVITDGVLSNPVTQYVLPPATQAVLGGVKVGEGLKIDHSVLSVRKSAVMESNLIIDEDFITVNSSTSYSISPVSIGRTATFTVDRESTWAIYTPVDVDTLDLTSPIKESSRILNFDYFISDDITATSYGPLTINRSVSVTVSPLSTWIIF
jgi:hypothetical protein